MRYQGIGTDFIGTSFLAWKGSTSYEKPYDLEATGASAVAPDELIATNCLAYTYYAWDEDENVVTVTTPAVEINQLPLADPATRRRRVSSFPAVMGGRSLSGRPPTGLPS